MAGRPCGSLRQLMQSVAEFSRCPLQCGGPVVHKIARGKSRNRWFAYLDQPNGRASGRSQNERLWNGRFWRKAAVRQADDHAGSESLVDIAVVPEGEGVGLSA